MVEFGQIVLCSLTLKSVAFARLRERCCCLKYRLSGRNLSTSEVFMLTKLL